MIPAVVLAAGRSTRMGRSKATLPINYRDTFLTRIVRTFLDAGVDDIVVVLGHDADAIAASMTATGLPVRFALNREYDRGQLSSLQAGLMLVDRPGVVAALVTLVDVPLVSAATVRRVLERYRSSGAVIVRPANGDRHGHPLLVDRRLFRALMTADPATGAKPIVHAHLSPESHVEVDDEGAFLDIDTPEEYERVRVSSSGAVDRASAD